MSDYYNILFDKKTILNTLFIDVKGVLNHPTLLDLKKNDVELFNEWCKIVNHSYDEDEPTNKTYQNKAPYYAEYNRVLLINYAFVHMEDGKIIRTFKKSYFKDDEALVIDTFFDELTFISEKSLEKTVATFPYICGYNIKSFQLPLLLKRYFKNYEDIVRNKQIPPILKKIIASKPWDLDVLDTQEIWKFGSYGNSSLTLISNTGNFKKKGDLLTLKEINDLYWSGDDIDEAVKKISFQSANEININIQFLNTLKEM